MIVMESGNVTILMKGNKNIMQLKISSEQPQNS